MLLGLIVLVIITASIMIHSKLYKKKKIEAKMQKNVTEEVTEYFKMAAAEENNTGSGPVGTWRVSWVRKSKQEDSHKD